MAIVAQLVAAWDGSNRAQLAAAWAENAPGLSITIDGDFERSCVDPALSSWDADYGDGEPIIRIQARRQTLRRRDGSYDTNQWLEPVARITGVQGVRPWVTFQPFNSTGDVDGYSNQTWTTSQRAHYSYDGITWTPFNAPAISASELRFRPPAAFEQDVVYVARSWPRSVTQVGNQIEAISAAHHDKVFPVPSAIAFTPSITTSFPAQNYILGEVSAKLNELGGSIPATPLYGFVIDDSAYVEKKKLAVMAAGVHASEDVGEIWLWEMVDFVLNGTSAEAIYARQHFKIHVYPLINTSGRAGGYWRGSPDHVDDPNVEWYEATPSHEFVGKIRAAILSDVGGASVAWAIDTHASRSGTRAQLGVRTGLPSTVEYDTRVRARYPAGSWSDYELRSIPIDLTSGTVRAFFTRELQPGLPMLHELCDRPGSVTPAVMRPYAEAAIGALADMDAAGWFDVVHELAGASIVATTASGSLSTGIQIEADAASITLSQGTLTTSIRLKADALSQAIAAAGLTTAVQLAAAAQMGAQASATLTTQPAGLAADASVAALAAGSLTVHIRLAADSVARVLATADLTVPGSAAELEADATALVLAEGGLTTAIRVEGAAVSFVQATGTLDMALTMRADAFVQAMASGVLSTQIRMDAAAVASVLARADLTGGMPVVPPAERTIPVRAQTRLIPA